MKKILITIAAGIAMTGCIRDERTAPSAVPITLTGTVTEFVDGTESLLGYSFTAQVIGSSISGDYTVLYASGDPAVPFDQRVDFAADGSAILNPVQYFPSSGDINVYIIGYVPATGERTGNTVSFTIDGSQDVMASDEVSGNNNSSALNLVFRHLLTQVQFTVSAVSDAARAAWGDITSIEIIDQNRVFDMLLSPANTILANASDMGVIAVTPAEAIGLPVSPAPGVSAGMAMIMPVSGVSPSNPLRLNIKTTQFPAGIVIELDAVAGGSSMTAGAAYNIDLTFEFAEITYATSLVPWAEASWGHTIGSPSESVILAGGNSYIVNATGEAVNLLIPISQAVKGVAAVNATGGPQLSFDSTAPWTGEVVWQTWDPTVSGTVTLTKYNNWFMAVSLPGTVPNGNNAVVAVKNTDGEIVWSWHLWITDYNPYSNTEMNGELHTYDGAAFREGGPFFGKKIMDRNLGATWTAADGLLIASVMTTPLTAVTAANSKTFGTVYQWGRKDPFTSSSSPTGTVLPIYNSTGITDIEIVNMNTVPNPDNNLSNAINNPKTFYYETVSPVDWYTRTPALQNNTLWGQASKSIFDPCPVGYRVPGGGPGAADNVWSGFGNGIFNSTANGSNAIFAWYANGVSGSASGVVNSPGRLYTGQGGARAWYPAAGSRSPNSSTTPFIQVGIVGYSWSNLPSTVPASPQLAHYFSYTTTTVIPANNYGRTGGLPVRCIQE